MNTITLYTTGPACMQCIMTKKALDKAEINYKEISLRESPAALEYIQDELGYTQAPVVVVTDEDHWSGFQPDQIRRVATTSTHPL